MAAAGSASAEAADPTDEGTVTWSVTPSSTDDGARESFDFTEKPGTQVVDTVVVTNRGTVAATFAISAADAINDSDTGALGLADSTRTQSDAGSWITTSVDEITLEPGSQASIPFSIVIPSDATPGNHLAGIVATLAGASLADPSRLEHRVATRVYLTVLGDIFSSVSISNIRTDYSASLLPFAPGTFAIEFDLTNNGNLVVDAYPSVALTGVAGVTLGERQVDPLQELLPGQRVRVSAEWESVFPAAVIWSDIAVTSDAPEAKREPVPEPTVGAQTATPIPLESAAPEVIDTTLDSDFDAATATTVTPAVSWATVILVGVVLLAALLARRFQVWSRQRLYGDIDAATRAHRSEVTAGGRAS